MQAVFGGGKKGGMNMVEMSPLMEENVAVDTDGSAPNVLNHAKYDDLDKILRMPVGGLQAPKPPASPTDGDIYGAPCATLARMGRAHR